MVIRPASRGVAFCASESLLYDITTAKAPGSGQSLGWKGEALKKKKRRKLVAHFTTCYPEPYQSSQVSMRVEC